MTASVIKLSQAQTTALHEINLKALQRLVTARKNTITSLLNAGLIREEEWDGEKSYVLTDEGFRAIGEPVVDREAVAKIQEIEDVTHVLDSDGILKPTPVGLDPATFDASWADWERQLMGFEATIGWKGAEVWNGLTAAEIREDMDTAVPVNRNARRTHYRTLRNAFRRMNNAEVEKSRKSQKITGAVGL